MEDDQPVTANLVFRANKRRKVLRKKGDDVDAGDPSVNHQDSHVVASTGSNQDDDAVTDAEMPQARSPHLSAIRRPKKHGIIFNSTATASYGPERNDEMAMVVAQSREPQVVEADNERFVRPTGKAAVMDDRHMSAFVDSKMAEMRSATATPTVHSPITQRPRRSVDPEIADPSQDSPAQEPAPQPIDSTNKAPTHPLNPNQRPTRPSKPPRRRREPIRSEADTARDALIDQIMHESQIPVYSQPPSHPPQTSNQNPTDGETDNDAAAAVAFKTDFLAAAEQRNLKRRPSAQPAAGAALGPKLGGSRAQRERMKAAEEAARRPGGGK